MSSRAEMHLWAYQLVSIHTWSTPFVHVSGTHKEMHVHARARMCAHTHMCFCAHAACACDNALAYVWKRAKKGMSAPCLCV